MKTSELLSKYEDGRRDFQDADLRDADLNGENLRDANLQGANLQGANLKGANLQDVNLQDVNLQDANLQDANLQGALLAGANFRGTKLNGVNLFGANLRGRPLKEAILQGARLTKNLKDLSWEPGPRPKKDEPRVENKIMENESTKIALRKSVKSGIQFGATSAFTDKCINVMSCVLINNGVPASVVEAPWFKPILMAGSVIAAREIATRMGHKTIAAVANKALEFQIALLTKDMISALLSDLAPLATAAMVATDDENIEDS